MTVILIVHWSVKEGDYSVEDKQFLCQHFLRVSLLAQGYVHVLVKLGGGEGVVLCITSSEITFLKTNKNPSPTEMLKIGFLSDWSTSCSRVWGSGGCEV